MKKILSIFLCLMLIVGSLPVFAEGETVSADDTYAELKYVVHDQSPYSAGTKVKLTFTSGDLSHVEEGNVYEIMWSGELLGNVGFNPEVGISVKVEVDTNNDGIFDGTDLVQDEMFFINTLETLVGLKIIVKSNLIEFQVVAPESVIPDDYHYFPELGEPDGSDEPGGPTEPDGTGEPGELPSSEVSMLYVKIFEPEDSYITTASMITIKVNESETIKETFAVDSILEDEIVSMKVPKFGPKHITIYMDDSSEAVVNHLLVEEETEYGYFMTVKANALETSVSEQPFALENVYTMELMARVGVDLPLWDPNVVDTFESIGTIEFNDSQTEYFVDIPIEFDPSGDERSYFTMRASDNEGSTFNAIVDVDIDRVSTYGSSGLNNGLVDYKTTSGYLRYNVLIRYLDESGAPIEKMIYVNAYHSYFTGLRINTSQVVGDWTHGDMEARMFGSGYSVDKDVYVSAEYATVSLSNTIYNKFEALELANEDTRATILEDGSIKLSLEGLDTTFDFILKATVKETGLVENIYIRISKKIVSMGTIRNNTNIEDAYVYYQPDDSFPMVNPKALVMLYYDVPNPEGPEYPRIVELIETKVLEFNTLEHYGIEFMNTDELAAYIGPVDMDNTDYGVPTRATVFLVEGDMSLESETFGGVKYGIGDGWNGAFGNYDW